MYDRKTCLVEQWAYYVYEDVFVIYVHACFLVLYRNERDTAFAMVKHKLTKEPDVFLGEKVIEVRRVGAPRDVWYKLGKIRSVLIYVHCTAYA